MSTFAAIAGVARGVPDRPADDGGYGWSGSIATMRRINLSLSLG